MITRLGYIQPLRAVYGARYLATSSTSSATSSTSTSQSNTSQKLWSDDPSSSDPSSSSIPTHHFITLLRSTIGLPDKYRATVRRLGLRRRHSVALHAFSKDTAGMILRIKELISVRNVTQAEGEELLKKRRDRSEGAGLEETGLAYGGSRKRELEERR